MSKITKNILIILGILSIGFAGYYLYNERSATVLQLGTDNEALTSMLEDTRVFMERSRVLDRTTLDVTFFEDERFTALRDFSGPVAEIPIGKSDPFADTDSIPVTPTGQ